MKVTHHLPLGFPLMLDFKVFQTFFLLYRMCSITFPNCNSLSFLLFLCHVQNNWWFWGLRKNERVSLIPCA